MLVVPRSSSRKATISISFWKVRATACRLIVISVKRASMVRATLMMRVETRLTAFNRWKERSSSRNR